MEMYSYHGRRGKETIVWGINRANQTFFLMLVMVATMVCVLLWEASPFTGAGVAHSPVHKSVPRSEIEEQAKLYESRPFLKSSALENKLIEDSQAALEEAETVLDAILPESKPATKRENEPTATDAILESIQRSSNETLAESEETSLAETETALAERASNDVGPSNSEDPIIEVDLEDGAPAKPLGSPSSEDVTLRENASSTSIAMNLSETEVDAIAQETEVEMKSNSYGKCDYSVGKWVLDETRPLYSGLECTKWLAPGFSCRRNNHPDKLLDRYRWQPAGCDLPEFNASAVLELLRNKVVAFVGDSLARQQLQSMLCMLTRGKNDTTVTNVGSDFGFFTPPGDRKARPNGFAYRFEATNATVIFKWTVTLANIQPLNISNPLTRNALHLDRPEQFLEDHLPQLDVVVLNSGHHWNGGKMKANRFDFYLHGKPVNKSSELSRVPVAYNTTVHNVVHWMSKAIEGTNKVVYYRSLSPRHFRNGDWNAGGTCDTIQFEVGKQVQEGNRLDSNAESATVGTNVNLLNITSLSLDRGETHVSKYGGGTGGQDCLHWCLPGIPDTWNEILFAELATKFKQVELYLAVGP